MRRLPFACLLLLPLPLRGQEQGPPPSLASLQQRAQAAEARGEFGAAAEVFLQLAKAAPAEAQWPLAAGRCLGRAGRYNDALDLLDQARQRFPAVLDLAAMQARTWLLKVEQAGGAMAPEVGLAEATALCEAVLKTDPDHQDAILILAQARYLAGDGDGARAAADEAARRHPQHPGAAILQGRLAADRCFELRRRLQDDDDAGLRQQLAAAQQTAVAAYERALVLDPDRAFPLVALGDLARADGDRAAAAARYTAALALDPDAAVDHAWIEQQFDWQQRRQLYESALQRYRQRPLPAPAKAATVRFYLGRALYDGREFLPALAVFADVLRDNPAYSNAAYYAAFAAFWGNDHDRAEQYAARFAAANARGFADLIRGLPDAQRAEVAGIVKYLADRAWKAGRQLPSRELNHVVACLFDDADAWNNYAFLCRETGAFAASFAAYELALQREPDSAQLHNDAAVVLHYHLPTPEHLQQARELYRRALELAEQVLQDAAATEPQRRRAQQAKSDAQANLQQLDGG